MLLEVEVTIPLCFYRLINSCSACHVLFPSIRLCCGVAIAPLSSHFSCSGLSRVQSPHRKLLPPPQTKHKDSWLTQQREMTPLPKTERQRNSNGYYGGNETREASCTRKYFGSPFASQYRVLLFTKARSSGLKAFKPLMKFSNGDRDLIHTTAPKEAQQCQKPELVPITRHTVLVSEVLAE